MAAPKVLKSLAERLGVFGPARRLYRKFSAEAHSKRAAEMALYGQLISKGDTVFDIGANLGLKSEVFLALGAKVIALEPNPHCQKSLTAEFGRNPDFTLVPEAVGAEPGTASLHFVDTSVTGSLRSDWPALQRTPGEITSSEVPVTTLDKLIQDHGLPIYCKIDVEGFEEEVLKGLSQAVRFASIEFHAEELDRLFACLDLLTRHGSTAFNVIEMHGASFMFDQWVDFDTLKDWIQSDKALKNGDVFIEITAN